MLVIMDMEWIEEKGRPVPTQLSALRVNERWEIRARYDQLMRPSSESPQAWDQMGFTGCLPADFIAAPDPVSALNAFSAWLCPEDILCWWSAPTAITFSQVHLSLLKSEPRNPIRLIRPALRKDLAQRGVSRHGSAYEISKSLGFPIFGTEHRSADDAGVICSLLRFLAVNPLAIMKAELSPSGKSDAPRRPEVSGASSPPAGEYLLDPVRQVVHAADCPRIPRRGSLLAVDALDAAIRQRARPCSCCRETYRSFSQEKAAQNIRKMQLNYIYSDTGLFHKPSCIHVRRMPYVSIRGCVRYDTAVRHGYRPCGWCRPEPSDEAEPHHIPASTLRKEKSRETAPQSTGLLRWNGCWEATRLLTEAEKTALKRHRTAAKERASLPAGLTGTAGRDAHVLTRTGYAFWAAEGYQNFHLRSCPRLVRLSNLRGFACFSDATRAGLTPCRHCRPTAKNDILVSVPIYQKNRDEENLDRIDAICREYGWQTSVALDEYRIETDAGKWILHLKTRPVDVFHINKVKTPENTDHYHRQNRLFLSLTDTVEYIRRHDAALMRRSVKAESSVFRSKVTGSGKLF